jgi:hypothetical protein
MLREFCTYGANSITFFFLQSLYLYEVHLGQFAYLHIQSFAHSLKFIQLIHQAFT